MCDTAAKAQHLVLSVAEARVHLVSGGPSLRRPLWRALVWLLTLTAASSRASLAQDTLRVDLATARAGGDTLPITTGRFVVLVTSKVPRFVYAARVVTLPRAVDPIATDKVFDSKRVMPQDSVACAALKGTLSAIEADFRTVDREEAIPALVARAERALDATATASCRGAIKELAQKVSQLRSETSGVAGVVSVKANEYVNVVIQRSSADGAAQRAWNVVFNTPTTGGWRTMFGFAALQTGTLGKAGLFESTRRYATEAVPKTTDQFVIREGKGPLLDLVPVVTLTYQTGPERGINAVPDISAGLGLDPSNPFLTLGIGWTFYSNLHVGIGLAARREDVLGSAYRVGDTVKTALSAQQLMTDRDFRLRPMLSLSFRFAANPFAGGGTRSGTDGKAPATPEPEKKTPTDPKPGDATKPSSPPGPAP